MSRWKRNLSGENMDVFLCIRVLWVHFLMLMYMGKIKYIWHRFPCFIRKKPLILPTWRYVLNNASENKDAAVRFLQYAAGYEAVLLYLLLQSPQTAFTKEQIYEQIWHEPTNNHLHAVENTIFQIRKRLKPYCMGHE